MSDTNDAKRELRARMRIVRRTTVDPDRSAAVVARLAELEELASARVVMLFDPLPGEPEVGPFAEVLREGGATVVVPEASPSATLPIPPSTVDAVVLPGLAFTREGDRLGQGGGWYDRFLGGVRADCVTVGVCFDEQVLDAIPTASHDVAMTFVVTPTAVHRRADATDPGT